MCFNEGRVLTDLVCGFMSIMLLLAKRLCVLEWKICFDHAKYGSEKVIGCFEATAKWIGHRAFE